MRVDVKELQLISIGEVTISEVIDIVCPIYWVVLISYSCFIVIDYCSHSYKTKVWLASSIFCFSKSRRKSFWCLAKSGLYISEYSTYLVYTSLTFYFLTISYFSLTSVSLLVFFLRFFLYDGDLTLHYSCF